MLVEKRCTKCGQIKALTDFCKTTNNKDGLSYDCKLCRKEYLHKWQQVNSNKVNLKQRELYADNPEKFKKRSKQWQALHPQQVKAGRNRWKKENPEKTKAITIKWKMEHPERIKELQRKWKVINPEKVKESNKKFRVNNPEKVKVAQKNWRTLHPEKAKEYGMKWRSANPDKVKEINRKSSQKRNYTSKGKLNNSTRVTIAKSLHGAKAGRHWEDLVGFTIDQLKRHIERRFKPGMTWGNYGTAWEVDHKIPVAAFHFEKPEDIDFKKCWALKNLQPLERAANRRKSDKLTKPFQPSLNISVSNVRMNNETRR